MMPISSAKARALNATKYKQSPAQNLPISKQSLPWNHAKGPVLENIPDRPFKGSAPHTNQARDLQAGTPAKKRTASLLVQGVKRQKGSGAVFLHAV